MVFEITAGWWFVLIGGAVVIDWMIGDPAAIPHPIVWIGKLIGALTKALNRGTPRARKAKGLLMWLLVVAITAGVTAGVQWLALRLHPAAFLLVTLWFLGTTLAEKSLRQAVAGVAAALGEGDLPSARRQVGWLCGRDTTQLSTHEVVRATVETTAENTVDGVLAPLFYMAVGLLTAHWLPWLNPLTLAMTYKAVNTMDSMVGYTQAPYRDFGCFPARLDDGFNWPIARIGSWMMLIGGALLGLDATNGARIYNRDRNNHKSPNAGHPESAAAGLLHIQIGGTNVYFGETVVKPTIGDADQPLSAWHIQTCVSIMLASEIVQTLFIAVAAGMALGLS